MRVVRVEVTETERGLLQNMIKKGSDWRERERAETILLLVEGHTTFDVAEKQGVLAETIRERRRKWFKLVSPASLISRAAARRASCVMNTASG